MSKIVKVNKKELRRVGRFEKAEWHKLDLEHYGEAMIEYMDNKFHLVVKENGKIIGTIKGTCELGVVYVSSLIVAEGRRGRGVGQALLGRAVKDGKKLGCHKVFLFTGASWRANEFYTHLGYKKTGQMLNFYHHHDFNIYEKDL